MTTSSIGSAPSVMIKALVDMRAQFDDRHEAALVFWHRACRARARQQDVTARHAKEVRYVLAVLWALVALPRQMTVEPELASLADGAHRAHVWHQAIL